MNYQLICSDVDGTLLGMNRELSDFTIREVQRIAQIPFVLVSSRMPRAMTHLQQQLGNINTPLVAYNGALILDGKEVIYSAEIATNLIEEIVNACKSTSIHLSFYNQDNWFVPAFDFWSKREEENTKVVPVLLSNQKVLSHWKETGNGAHKVMCMGSENEIDQLYGYLERNFSNKIALYRSKETYIEISPKSISKKTAIEFLLQSNYPTLTMKNVIAFGDNFNDIEMLQSVGLGIAVANAKEEVLKVAKQITDSNKNDGVAKMLQQLF